MTHHHYSAESVVASEARLWGALVRQPEAWEVVRSGLLEADVQFLGLHRVDDSKPPADALTSQQTQVLRATDNGRRWLRAGLNLTSSGDVHDLAATHYRERDAFVAANMGLVYTVARRYVRPGRDEGDIVQDGALGLVRGLEKFDPSMGFRFSTYAGWWIRCAIQKTLGDSLVVRLPHHVLDTRRTVAQVARRLMALYGREPTALEVAEYSGLTVVRVQSAMRHSSTALYLDTAVGDGPTTYLDQLQEAPTAFDHAAAREWGDHVERLLRTLPPKEAAVLRARFGLDDGEERTLNHLASSQRVSRERIRQLQEQALERLRKRAMRERLDVA